MTLSFKRITSSGSFIPEIDGLRFIAIASVVLFHLRGFISVKDLHTYADTVDYGWLNHLLSHGHLGVPLFFVISGFILGMPFGNCYLAAGNPVSLGKYFARRLTRLEPPYILVMTIFLLGAVYVTKGMPLSQALRSYGASLIYSHNIIFGRDVMPINAVAWSLEIEIQFYILAPILALLFTVRNPGIRRLTMAGIALLFLSISHLTPLHVVSIVDYLHYFMAGFLLVDLKVSRSTNLPRFKIDSLIALFFFSAIWIFDTNDFASPVKQLMWDSLQLLFIFVFYSYILFNNVFRFLSARLITNIGGMCYTIYLIHYQAISLCGNRLLPHLYSQWRFVNVAIYSVVILTVMMVLASGYFILVERPCMDKDWLRKLLGKKNVLS